MQNSSLLWQPVCLGLHIGWHHIAYVGRSSSTAKYELYSTLMRRTLKRWLSSSHSMLVAVHSHIYCCSAVCCHCDVIVIYFAAASSAIFSGLIVNEDRICFASCFFRPTSLPSYIHSNLGEHCPGCYAWNDFSWGRMQMQDHSLFQLR